MTNPNAIRVIKEALDEMLNAGFTEVKAIRFGEDAVVCDVEVDGVVQIYRYELIGIEGLHRIK